MQRVLSKKGIEVFKILPLSHPLLRTKTQPFQFPMTDQDEETINLMVGITLHYIKDTLRNSEIPSIALAGPQVGYMKSVFITGLNRVNMTKAALNKQGYLTKLRKVEIIINPSIVYSTDRVPSEEVCLSLPDVIIYLLYKETT